MEALFKKTKQKSTTGVFETRGRGANAHHLYCHISSPLAASEAPFTPGIPCGMTHKPLHLNATKTRQ